MKLSGVDFVRNGTVQANHSTRGAERMKAGGGEARQATTIEFPEFLMFASRKVVSAANTPWSKARLPPTEHSNSLPAFPQARDCSGQPGAWFHEFISPQHGRIAFGEDCDLLQLCRR
jgi:hypothetical protein